MMRNFFMVGLGSCLGGVLRYALSLTLQMFHATFPLATFVVNFVGCFLIGLFGALVVKYQLPEYVALLLTVGLCGGFTTFSTFSKENMHLLYGGQYFIFATYTISSIVLGIIAVLVGMKMINH